MLSMLNAQITKFPKKLAVVAHGSAYNCAKLELFVIL